MNSSERFDLPPTNCMAVQGFHSYYKRDKAGGAGIVATPRPCTESCVNAFRNALQNSDGEVQDPKF